MFSATVIIHTNNTGILCELS